MIMKRFIFMVMIALMPSAFCLAQTPTEVDKFLNDFKSLVERMNKVETPTTEQISAWKGEYAAYKELFDEKYEKQMNDDQVELYYNYRAQYRKKLGHENLKEAGEFIDTTSQKVGKSIKRGAKKLSGTLKGIFKRNKKE